MRGGGLSTHVVKVDGRERKFLLYVSGSRARDQARPLIVALHGGGSTPAALAAVTQPNRAGSRDSFVIAYPAGYRKLWHTDDDCCGPPLTENVDDVAFVSAVIDEVQRLVAVDPRRMFALGFSNGGRMTHRLGCELADRIAAIAVGSCSLGFQACRPGRPVPAIAFHGTADTFSPYHGGVGTAAPIRVKQLGAPATARRWAELNGCGETPRMFFEKGSVTAVRYGGCDDDAEVILYTVAGMGHQWPGHTIDISPTTASSLGLPQYLTKLGPGTREIDATALTLAFFRHHPMPKH